MAVFKSFRLDIAIYSPYLISSLITLFLELITSLVNPSFFIIAITELIDLYLSLLSIIYPYLQLTMVILFTLTGENILWILLFVFNLIVRIINQLRTKLLI